MLYGGGMANGTVDTMKLVEKFEAAGFEESKAKALAEEFGELVNNQIVTREYLDNRLERLELRMTIKTAIIFAAVLTFFKMIEPFFGG